MEKKVYFYKVYSCKCSSNGKFNTSALRETKIIFKNEADAKAYCQKQCNMRHDVIFIYKPFEVVNTNRSKINDENCSTL